ncbi:hypothetical protein [Kitasatospora sp. NPDC001527]|uniref:hypothetical protein n=1 Tax=Kitasatospora sp. NPDC001527 TaxID=3154519 RepID=UPI003328E2BC
MSVTGAGAGAGGGGGGTSTPTASGSAAAPDYAEQLRQGVAEHDRLFPQVAALGCASARPTPSTAGTGAAPAAPAAPAEPADPWAAKHAENSMYKQMAPLTAVDRCRGEAHGQRISEALKARAAKAPLTQDDVRGILESLGYPRDSAQLAAVGGEISFELTVPGTGPCVGGRLGSTVTVQAHGFYLDGGCTEPKGGH